MPIVNSNLKVCATCTYWGGPRDGFAGASPITQMLSAIVLETSDIRGKCNNSKNYGSKRAMDTCSFFSKQGNLS